jgi:LemA protein
MRHKLIFTLFLIMGSLLSGCGYNTLQSTDEQIKASGPRC